MCASTAPTKWRTITYERNFNTLRNAEILRAVSETTGSGFSVTDYQRFIESKRYVMADDPIGEVSIDPNLFDFQEAVVRWAVAKGRACVFAGTGLGKTIMQCEWARHVPGKRLIVAPLAVATQTAAEAESKIGLTVKHIKEPSQVDGDGVYVSNYERALSLDVKWDGVVLDESSILKSHDGAYRKGLTDMFSRTRYKLCCTATPAPNDLMELANHAEFIGAMTRLECLATFFTHDGGDTSKWRLKRHAVKDFWDWVSSWAVAFDSPSDIGFDGARFILPELKTFEHRCHVDTGGQGGLFGDQDPGATKLYTVLRNSQAQRVEIASRLVSAEPDEQWCVWCHTNDEQDELEASISGAVGVRGDDHPDYKEKSLLGFAKGDFRVLVTKPKIAGFGMNWQNCRRTVFASVTYSYEQQYQAVRRFWRFGQTKPVHVHTITANTEESVMSAVNFKAAVHSSIARSMSGNFKRHA